MNSSIPVLSYTHLTHAHHHPRAPDNLFALWVTLYSKLRVITAACTGELISVLPHYTAQVYQNVWTGELLALFLFPLASFDFPSLLLSSLSSHS